MGQPFVDLVPVGLFLGKAIVLGDKAGIHMDIKNAFSISGISHLLAVSGLHLMLFAGVIFFILRIGLCLLPGIALRYNTKKAAAVLALCFAITYMAVSGYGYPVVRATIMFALIMGGIILDRTSLSMRSVAIAATIILIITPQSVLSISFLLSFAAVIGLIAFYEDAHYWTHPWSRGWWELSLTWLVKIAGWIALLPFGKIYIPPPQNTWPLVIMVISILWLCIWQKRWRYWGLYGFLLAVLGYKPASILDEFHHPDLDLHAIRKGDKLLTPQMRRGKFVLEEWARVYGLALELAPPESIS